MYTDLDKESYELSMQLLFLAEDVSDVMGESGISLGNIALTKDIMREISNELKFSFP